MTTPDPHIWPDPFDDYTRRIRELEATISRVRGVIDSWRAYEPSSAHPVEIGREAATWDHVNELARALEGK